MFERQCSSAAGPPQLKPSPEPETVHASLQQVAAEIVGQGVRFVEVKWNEKEEVSVRLNGDGSSPSQLFKVLLAAGDPEDLLEWCAPDGWALLCSSEATVSCRSVVTHYPRTKCSCLNWPTSRVRVGRGRCGESHVSPFGAYQFKRLSFFLYLIILIQQQVREETPNRKAWVR